MPRVARKHLQSDFIHIVTEGIKKEFIFYQDKYKSEYILLLKKYISEKNNVKLISYCVLSNHAHILIYTQDIKEVSSIMRKINTAYAIYYNKLEDRVGHVFANRYYSQDIKDEIHLIRCIKYIHQNPVKAGLVNSPSKYKFSSYREFNENKLEAEISKLIFGTEDYLSKFYDFDIDNNNELIDISSETKNKDNNKLNIEKIIDDFCNEFKVNLTQIKGSSYLILRFKEYLNQNFQISNKTICGILGIGKNRIREIEKRLGATKK